MSERPGLAKAGLYFDGAGSNALGETLRSEAERIASELPAGVRQRAGERVRQMPVIPHQKVMAKAPEPFDYAYELSSPHEESREAMAEAIFRMGEALGDRIDRTRAAVLIGREIAITSGDGPIYNIMPLRRLPGMDHEDFMAQWFDRHATLGEGVAGVRYRQNHFDYRSTEALAARMGLDFPEMDGITESFFDSVEAAVEILSQEDVAVGAIEDERRFIDHDRSQFGLYRTIWHHG